MQKLSLRVYKAVADSGLLSRPIVQKLYSAAYFSYKRRLEDPFAALAHRHPELFRGGHIIDVGANIGYTTTVFAKAMSGAFEVWAFEPASSNFRLLAQNTRKLGSRVNAVNAALGDTTGTARLVINATHPGDHHIETHTSNSAASSIETVPLTTLDAVVQSKNIGPICFIKIDVQGYEMNVCHGMKETLTANPQATVAVECSSSALTQFGASIDGLTNFFSERGYRGYVVSQNGTLHPIDESSDTRVIRHDYYDAVFLPRVRVTESAQW